MFALQSVWPSAFFEDTLAYNPDGDIDERQFEFRGPGQPYPGTKQALDRGIALLAKYALTGNADDVARARRMVRVKDVPTVARMVEGLPALVYQVRLARVLDGRTEPAAVRAVAAVAARAIDPDDPWADEIREIRGGGKPKPKRKPAPKPRPTPKPKRR